MRKGHPATFFYDDFLHGLQAHRDAWAFTRKHKLWAGFWQYGWFSKFLIFIGILLGLRFFLLLLEWYGEVKIDSPLALGASAASLFETLFQGGYQLYLGGGFKYLIFILSHVLLFHFTRRTQQILKGESPSGSFKAFLHSEVRVLKVSLVSFILESIVIALIHPALDLLRVSFLHHFLAWGIQAFFLGWVIIDSCFDAEKLTIRQSRRKALEVPGLTTAIGAIALILMLVPLVGPVASAFWAAVAANLALFEYQMRGWLTFDFKITS